MSTRRRSLKTSGAKQEGRTARGTFEKGTSGNPRGRRPGIPNRATLEVKQFFTHLLTDPVYTRNLLKRLQEGTAGATEQMAFYYAVGKPKETIALDKTSIEALVEAASKLGDPGREPID